MVFVFEFGGKALLMPHYNQNPSAMTIFHSRSVKGFDLTLPLPSTYEWIMVALL